MASRHDPGAKGPGFESQIIRHFRKKNEAVSKIRNPAYRGCMVPHILESP